MSRFFKTDRGKRSAATIHLGAFGKHPAWPEHIIGLANQERLVWLMDVLYERGIRANIDSGEWQRLEDEGAHQNFGHLFLWYRPGEIILGRLWESTDFKARPRYPMVVAAVCQHLSLSWVLEHIAPKLEEVERQCKRIAEEFPAAPAGTETSRAEAEQQVLDLIETTRREFEEAVSTVEASAEVIEPDPHALALIANHPLMGPKRKGFYNLAFQTQRVMSAYRRGAPATKSPAPQRLRVPPCAGNSLQAVLTWLNLLLSEFDPSWPFLIFAPDNRRFLDVIVGDPGTAEFVCLRASLKAIPLTTQIDYPIEPDFARQLDEIIDAAPSAENPPSDSSTDDPAEPASLQPEAVINSDPADIGQTSRPAFPPGAGAKVKSSQQSWKILLIVAGVMGFGAIVAAIIWLSFGGNPFRRSEKIAVSRSGGSGAVLTSGSAPTDTAGNDPRVKLTPAELTDSAVTLLKELKDKWNQEPTQPSTPFEPLERRSAELAARINVLWAMSWKNADNHSRIVRELAQVQAESQRLEEDLRSALELQSERVRKTRSFLTELAASRQFASPALSVAWIKKRDGLLAEFQKTRDLDSLQSKSQQIRTLFDQLEQWQKTIANLVDLKLSGELSWLMPAQRFTTAKAQNLIDASLDRVIGEFAPNTGAAVLQSLEAVLVKEKASIDAAIEPTKATFHDLAAAQDLLERGYGLVSIPTVDTNNASRLVERATANAAYSEIAVDAELSASLKASLFDRMARLKEASGASDVNSLATIAADGKAPLDVRLAAWRRLGQLDRWPSTIDQLKYENALRSDLINAAAHQKWDEAPRSDAETELQNAGARRWARFVDGLTGSTEQIETGITAAIAMRQPMQAASAAISQTATFNLNLYDLRQKVRAAAAANTPGGEASVSQAIDGFCTVTEKLDPSAVVDQLQVSGLLRQLRLLIQDDGARSNSDSSGPEKQGWTRLPKAVGKDGVLSFSWKGPSGTTYAIDFVRVDPSSDGSRPFFLSSSEVPVGLCIELFEAASDPKGLPELLQRDLAPGRQPGPHSWTWRPDEKGPHIMLSPQWIGTAAWSSAYSASFSKIAPPTATHPMQYLTPQAAIYLAAKVGCRLPSSQEWDQALMLQRRHSSGGPYNLRDEAFRRQREIAVGLAPSAKNPARSDLWPDNGIFDPWGKFARREQVRLWDHAPWLEPSAPTYQGIPDDGTVWFWPVDQPAAGPFYNLIGNVAEYVCDAKTDDQPAQLTHAAISAWLNQPGRQLAVIGGSALSPPPPELDYEKPAIIPDLRGIEGGYSDVGFRLAFSAGPKVLVASVTELLKGTAYLSNDAKAVRPSP